MSRALDYSPSSTFSSRRSSVQESQPRVPHHGLITASMMLATTMHALDTTIANVALPHIQGSLAATQEQMSWVLTSYIVAAAVMVPLGAWIANRIGRKKFFMICIASFTVTSVLCGLAQNLSQIVVFRLLQGLSGATIVPLSQAVLLDINPPHRHARAMAVWVMGVTIGPIFGAPLGGWITEYLNWRWCFYINVPVGIFCLLTMLSSLPETPKLKRPFDWFGFMTLSIATFSLQLMLDRGQLKDWFSSPEIWLEATFAGLAAYLFVVHMATSRNSFINPHLFEDRNYTTGSILGLLIGVLMMGPLILMTLLLQNLMQYPVILASMVIGSRAIGTVGAGMIIARLLRYLDGRIVMAIGFSVTAYALVEMCRFNLQMPFTLVFWSGVLYGFGITIASVPISTITFATLPAHMRNEGAAFGNLMRNIGGSAGIALMTTLLTRNTQIMHARLAEHVTPFGTALRNAGDLHSTAGLIAMDGRVLQQASMLAYNNLFKLLLILTILAIPLAFVFRKPPPQRAVATQ